MHAIIDRLLILAGCFFLLDVSDQIELSLIVMLTAITISEFTYAIEWKWLYHGTTIAYLVACVVQPAFFWLLPLVLYESIIRKNMAYCFCGCVLFVYYIPSMDTFERFYIFFLACLVVVLGTRTIKVKELYRNYIGLLDDSKQMEIIMNAKNHEILENQDVEVHLATLQERNRIAREIHDNVGHMLSRSILMVGASIAMNKDDNLKECLGDLKDTLDQAMNSIRSSVHDLHDDSIDLEDTVRQLVREFTFCKMTLDYDVTKNVDRKVKLCFIAILKEASSNIMKHSNATQVEVVMREHPAIYQLLISDNGTVSKNASQDGIGLSNMQERVQGLKGTITISKEHGYRIFVMIPKEKNEL